MLEAKCFWVSTLSVHDSVIHVTSVFLSHCPSTEVDKVCISEKSLNFILEFFYETSVPMLCWVLEDLIEIQDVALLNASEDWTEDVYSLSASVMDGVSFI